MERLWTPALLHQSPARLDPFAEILLPQEELTRLRDEHQARVNGSARVAHARLLHPDLPGTKGKVSLMRATVQKDGELKWETRIVTVSELPGSDALLWGTHVSMQRFYGARGATSLTQVQALICDCDCHDQAAFRGLTPEEMAGLLIERIEAAGLPLPSYILFSGRGLHVVWLHEPRMASPAFMKRWRAVQCALHGPKGGKAARTVRLATGTRVQDERVVAHEERIAAVWRGAGLDRSACDTARVLRLAGSYNHKSGKEARLVWPSSWTDIERHDFEDLARAFLPYSREEMSAILAERDAAWRQREEAREARRAEAEAAGIVLPEDKPRRRKSGGYWPSVVESLDAIRMWWGGTPPEGRRDLWAFLSACAIGMTEGGDAAGWAARLAPLSSLPEAELRTSFGALERLLRRHEAGETSERDGVERPAMYVYSKARMLALLGLSEEDAAAAGAHALLPGGASRQRSEKERSAERRAAAGATRHAVSISARLADGREALALQAAGKTMPQIVAAFVGRRGETSIRRAMREAAAEAPVETVFETSEEGSVPTLHDPTSPIVALPGALAPSVAPALPEPFRQAVPGSEIRISHPSHPSEAQGASYNPPPIWVSEDTGLPSGHPISAFPGPSLDPVRLPSEAELPAFLVWLTEGRFPEQTPGRT